MFWALIVGYGILRVIGFSRAASRGRGGRYLFNSYAHKSLARGLRKW